MITHMLKPWFKTLNSKQKRQRAQKDKKLVFQKIGISRKGRPA